LPELPYQLFDCDTHCYEARDAFTRFMPKGKLQTAVTPVRLPSGKEILLANDRVITALEQDLDKAYVPGSLAEMLRQRASGNPSDAERFYEDIRPEYTDRGKRLAQMDAQQVERTVLFPGGWGLLAEPYLDDTVALYDNLRSFNRWFNEDWGFNHADRIYAPALLSLRDLDLAVAELDRVIAEGAKFIMLAAGPAFGRSPGDPYFDPFWSRVNEAKLTVAYHIGESGYQGTVASQWGWKLVPPFQFSAWQWNNTYGERPIVDTLSALIFDNLFGRYPNIHVVVAEFGAEWVPHTLRHLDKSRGMGRNGPWLGGQLDRRPSEIFKQHIHVVPYPEDDTVKLAEQLGGVDCLVMGSDWPHAEGLAEPADFADRVAALGPEATRRIMRDNALALVTA